MSGLIQPFKVNPQEVPVADNQKINEPEDQGWINIHEPYELRDWAIYFSVSREKIMATVMATGPMVVDVKRYLGK